MLRHHWGPDGARWQGRRPGAGLCVFDPLDDPAALTRAARGCRAILCLAGVVGERAAAGADLADNAALAEAAVRAGAETGARVLLTSSAAVYGPRTGPGAGICAETDALRPVSPYGRAKAEMEDRGADLGARLGVAVSALRIGNVAGSDAILGGWRDGFMLDRFADGRTPARSYIGPATLARVLWDLAIRPGTEPDTGSESGDLPGVINLASPGAVEMGALLDAAGLGWTPRPAPDGAIARVCLSTDRLAGLVRLEAAEATAPAMVAQWQAMRREMKGNR